MTSDLHIGDHVRLMRTIRLEGHRYRPGLVCTVIRAWPDGGLYVLLMDGRHAEILTPSEAYFKKVKEQANGR